MTNPDPWPESTDDQLQEARILIGTYDRLGAEARTQGQGPAIIAEAQARATLAIAEALDRVVAELTQAREVLARIATELEPVVTPPPAEDWPAEREG